jgi:ribonuclease HII
VLEFERTAWSAGCRFVAGLDEVGRGPLAGPVVACAVVFDPSLFRSGIPETLRGLTDSKKLSPSRRTVFFERLVSHAEIFYGLGRAEVEDIDRINILQATWLAMERAVQALPVQPDALLVDGSRTPPWSSSAQALVKGDGRSLSIAAASVIAKVLRDREMEDLDRIYPGYGFARNRGYGTAEHIKALGELGPCACHRRTFRPVSQLELPLR